MTGKEIAKLQEQEGERLREIGSAAAGRSLELLCGAPAGSYRGTVHGTPIFEVQDLTDFQNVRR